MKRFMKAIAALMLTVAVVCAACTKDPENGGNNNGNGGSGGNGGGNGGSGNGTEMTTGMYLGVIGFNTTLHTFPITDLNEHISEVKSFIRSLEMDDATLLLESVNTSLDMLTSSDIPRDLINVSILNFTDGMDEGSCNYSNNHHGTHYTNESQYLQVLTQRILTEKIAEIPIEAHTIAFKGADVYDEQLFETTINGISSLPYSKYVHKVNDFSEVQAYFREIAENLHQTSTNSILTMRFPVPNNTNTRLRFTFDPVEDVSQSQQYIEGVFVMGSDGNGVLTNVRYVGLSSSSGGTVTASSTGDVKVEFKFEGMKDANGNNFSDSNITNVKKWTRLNNDTWVHNSEWHSSGNTQVNNEYYSSLIILNLDCSLSLGNNAFGQLQDAAMEFVDILKTN
ncbi:MAG: hypothetical protein F082_263 [bacterium F082]|nr:MAG: hypothetical protein F082_263 [bacterium F082]